MGGTVKRYYAPITLYKHQVDAARQIMEQGESGFYIWRWAQEKPCPLSRWLVH